MGSGEPVPDEQEHRPTGFVRTTLSSVNESGAGCSAIPVKYES